MKYTVIIDRGYIAGKDYIKLRVYDFGRRTKPHPLNRTEAIKGLYRRYLAYIECSKKLFKIEIADSKEMLGKPTNCWAWVAETPFSSLRQVTVLTKNECIQTALKKFNWCIEKLGRE